MAHKANEISWRAPEFLYKKKTLLWKLNVSVFFFLVLLIMLFLSQWIGAIIIALLYWFFMLHADEKPGVVDYRLTRSGITIGERKISYSDIRSFSVDASHTHPVVILELNHYFALPVTLVIKKDALEEVLDYLAQYIPLNQAFSLTRWLTHWLHY